MFWAIPGLAGDVLIQPASWIGVPGMTLATFVLAAAPALGLRVCLAAGVAMLAWVGFGIHRLSQPVTPAPGVSVVLVQGNVAQGQKWDRALASDVFERYLRLTEQGVAQAMQAQPAQRVIVMWPESASPYLLDREPGARAAIWEAARPAAAVIVGSIRFDPASGDPYNSMFVLSGPDTVAGIYDKWHLVPFGEFAPSWVPFAVQVVPGHPFAFGSGPKTFHVAGLPSFGGFICYEAIYPAQLVDEEDRPDWLVNITNDAWFGNSTGPRQHLAAVRLRAVEEGLPVLRAANTGITAAFDALGRELIRLPPQVAAETVVSLPGQRGRTPFSRQGLAVPLLLSLGACAAGLGAVRRGGRGRFTGPSL